MTQLNRWLVGAVLPIFISLVGLGLYWQLGSSEPKRVGTDGKDPASLLAKLAIISVDKILPFGTDQSLDIEVSGTVVPYRQITVAAEIPGRIKTKNELCRVGHFVKEGDLLFELDATDFQLDVDRLTALRDAEYAQQRELDQELANAERSLELAEQEVVLQEQEISRLERLPDGFASQSELDQAKRIRLASQNQRLTIQNQTALLKTRRARISLAEKLAGTQLEQSKVNLARTKIVAPISGVIVSESVEEDSYVAKGAALCTIDDTQRVEVLCNLRADQMLLILDQATNQTTNNVDSNRTASKDSIDNNMQGPNQYELPKTPVTVAYQVAGRDDMVFRWDGQLSRYDGIGLDPQSRTVPVRVRVDDPRRVVSKSTPTFNQSGGPPALVRGMFVECTFHTKPNRPLMLIPKLALKPGNQVWSFTSDPSIIRSQESTNNIHVSEEVALPSAKPGIQANNQTTNRMNLSQPMLNIEEWIPGRVTVINKMHTLSTVRIPDQVDGSEYWVAEMKSNLQPGDLTVVSPLANLIGDGSDKVRIFAK
jgi:multidrug efflux pump subunit AcrA (membrane-fusion protein)